LSIRLRLILLVLCVALPCAGAMVWAVVATYSREQDSVTQSLRETTRALALAVGRELNAAEAVGRTLAASSDLAGGNLAAFYDQAQRVTMPGGGWVVLLDDERMVLNTSQPMGIPLPARRPAPGRLAHPVGNGVDISTVFSGPITGRRAVAITVATPRAGGGQYDISVVVPPERIQRVLDDQRLPEGWIGTVLDQAGTVVARRPGGLRWAGALVSETMRRRSADEQEGFFRSKSLEGVQNTSFFSRVPGSRWSLAIAVPDRLLREKALRSVLATTAVAGAMLVLALLAAFVVARRLVAPARGLADAATALDNDGAVHYVPQGVAELDAAGSALTLAASRIRDANRVLEERIGQAIEHARDAQQKVEAAQRLEALGRLTGGVAHDVNNLLAVVSNSATLLQRRPDDPNREKRLDAIQRAVASGRELTQKLMSFARQRSHDARALDLRSWLPALLPALQDAAGPRTSIELDLASDTAPVSVDATEMRLALLNLAANAGHAMPRGGRLRIATHNGLLGETQTPAVFVTVADGGPGVAEALRGRIFEPFFTTRGAEGGAGLGLSQVYGFCELSGGTVRVDSSDAGATFTLGLPAAERGTFAVATPAIPRPAGQKRLLYVEDNVALGELSKVVLEDLHYDVTWALSGDAALSESRRAAFDIVLSDFALPGSLNGLELGLRIRGEQPRLPFVLLTGYADQGVQAAEAGFDVLYKPCPVEQLEATLARAGGAPAPNADALA
jgi:signal transduction histidine kinase/ActR/RegA family two-component response regulator